MFLGVKILILFSRGEHVCVVFLKQIHRDSGGELTWVQPNLQNPRCIPGQPCFCGPALVWPQTAGPTHPTALWCPAGQLRKPPNISEPGNAQNNIGGCRLLVKEAHRLPNPMEHYEPLDKLSTTSHVILCIPWFWNGGWLSQLGPSYRSRTTSGWIRQCAELRGFAWCAVPWCPELLEVLPNLAVVMKPCNTCWKHGKTFLKQIRI